MDIKEYQHWVRETLDSPHKHTSRQDALVHFVLGLNGEVGEVTEIIKKELYGGKEPTEPMVAELGDVMWYLTALCCTLNIDLRDMLQYNYQKLLTRYKFRKPEGTCIGCSHRQPSEPGGYDTCLNAEARICDKGCEGYAR